MHTVQRYIFGTTPRTLPKSWNCFTMTLSLLLIVTMGSASAQWGSRSLTIVESQSKTSSASIKDQVYEHSVLVEFESIVTEWKAMSKDISVYEGLLKYCDDQAYRDEVDALLGGIHHYDTLMYRILIKKRDQYADNKEIQQTLKKIQKIEHKFKPSHFHRHLNNDCHKSKKLEKNRDALKNDLHMNSYQGQIFLIESDMQQYTNRITRMVNLINKSAAHFID